MQFRVEKAGIVHAGVGKASFGAEQLVDNVRAFVDAVNRAKPTGAKGTYLKRAHLSSTMGPGVKLDIAEPGRRAEPAGRSRAASQAKMGLRSARRQRYLHELRGNVDALAIRGSVRGLRVALCASVARRDAPGSSGRLTSRREPRSARCSEAVVLRAEKAQVIDDLNAVFRASGVVVVTHYKGLTVAEITDFAARCGRPAPRSG